MAESPITKRSVIGSSIVQSERLVVSIAIELLLASSNWLLLRRCAEGRSAIVSLGAGTSLS